ncbi:MAG: DivIVA domain-containing protein [Acidimicrobiales bacterium]|nr:DivIVA domain-containing protein [Acidimicrobiales bacterium]
MELTLKRYLEEAEFSQSKRGYDRDEVDEFLDRAVAMATKVEAKLTQTMEEARRTTFGPAGPPARSEAEIEAEIERRVAVRLAEAEASAAAAAPAAPPLAAQPGPTEEEHAEEMRRTLVLAQRTADAAIREAREDAEKLRAEADQEVAALRSEAESEVQRRRADLDRELAEARNNANQNVREEIAELEGVREALRADVGVLERHVEEQRNQLRSTVGELQRLLEDPAGFRLAPTPALLDPEIPRLDPVEAGDEEPSEPEDETHDFTAGQVIEAPPVEHAAPVSIESPEEQGGLSFGDVEHEPPIPSGPPTEEIATTGDPFMDELRKAMSDDEPLGPRDDAPGGPAADRSVGLDDDERRGWRFGRRR